MLSTNYALRPLIREDSDSSEAWEILEIVNDDRDTVFTKRVGIVETPQMGHTPLTLLQFLLASYNDQHPKIVDAVAEEIQEYDTIEDVSFQEV